ncbi:type II toxin-antitoxin system RelE/ParE family toxin, partial [Streptococcus oralis]|uniref:type II toxin-antitoxin system RelE/ParE family toxin n=1 Tax=Streptococcus oralis TaxID=1303 RepID=UPI0013E965B8
MVYEVHIAKSAEEDLEAIFSYCEENFTLETAERTLKVLGESILQLEIFPEGFVNFEERVGRKIF